jgi:hypothetical protein
VNAPDFSRGRILPLPPMGSVHGHETLVDRERSD